jgi:HEAT repeat protein
MKDPEATRWLINALDDTEPDVRLATVALLGRLGSREVEQRLVSMMRQDRDVGVRLAAEKALRVTLL